MKGHDDFIKTPISRILQEAVIATSSIGDGIETYPLSEYIMQSLFLKMTGFQEQKMKCICWELASRDYEYRYERYTKSPLGECSNYKEKNDILKDLHKQILKYNNVFDINILDKESIKDRVSIAIDHIFLDTNLKVWMLDKFYLYTDFKSKIETKHFANENKKGLSLFLHEEKQFSLKEIYQNHLYKHRNRLAHNTLSYQHNLPTLSVLQAEEYKYDNYFLWFAILMIIDEVVIELYTHYLDVYDETKF